MQCRRPGFDPWVGKIPWRKEWQPTPVFLPGESHGQRSLALQSMGSQRVRPNQVTNAHDLAAITGCFLFLCLFFTSLSTRTESQRVFSIKQSILVSQQIAVTCLTYCMCRVHRTVTVILIFLPSQLLPVSPRLASSHCFISSEAANSGAVEPGAHGSHVGLSAPFPQMAVISEGRRREARPLSHQKPPVIVFM